MGRYLVLVMLVAVLLAGCGPETLALGGAVQVAATQRHRPNKTANAVAMTTRGRRCCSGGCIIVALRLWNWQSVDHPDCWSTPVRWEALHDTVTRVPS